jgi:two-component system sensor histidine kinase KdpD
VLSWKQGTPLDMLTESMDSEQREALGGGSSVPRVTPTSFEDTPRRALTASMAQPDSPSAYAQSAVIVGLCTLLAWQMAPYFRPASLLMMYLMGTVVVATRLGRGPSIMAALLSMIIFDFLFIPLQFQFAISDTEYLFALAVVLVVTVIISTRSARLREHAVAVR